MRPLGVPCDVRFRTASEPPLCKGRWHGVPFFWEGYGLKAVRIPNNEVNHNFRRVCEYIDAAVKQSLSQLRRQLQAAFDSAT